MWSKIIAAAVLGLGVTGSGFFIAHGLMESRQYTRYVEVKGLAERVVKSDEAVWTLNFKLVNNDLTALYQTISDAQNKTKQFFVNQGFKAEEISINTVTLTDNQSNSYNQNEAMPRYAADAGLTLSTNDVDKVSNALQKTGDLVQQGVVVTSSNAIYRFTKLNDIKPEMLDEATASAKEAGLSFSKRATSVLGGIRRATQGLFSITDANSSYDSGTAVMKKVRVVTTVEYQLQ